MENRRELVKDIILSFLAAIVAAININTFVNSGGLIPGGFSGISLIIIRIAKDYFNVTLDYSLIYLLFNIPSTILVFNTISKRFTFISLIDVIFTSLFVSILPKFAITDDLLLVSIFGGIVGGISSSLVLAGDGCGGGMDFVTIYFAKKKHKSIWNEMLLLNGSLLLLSGVLFGWESALYSIIFQFVTTQVVNAFDNRYKRSSLIIISDKEEEIASMVYQKFQHSVTIFDAIGGYTNTKRKVLYIVVGEYEVNQLIAMVKEIDEHAFINISNNQRVIGNFREKPY